MPQVKKAIHILILEILSYTDFEEIEGENGKLTYQLHPNNPKKILTHEYKQGHHIWKIEERD